MHFRQQMLSRPEINILYQLSLDRQRGCALLPTAKAGELNGTSCQASVEYSICIVGYSFQARGCWEALKSGLLEDGRVLIVGGLFHI